jgi:hypothetical protein
MACMEQESYCMCPRGDRFGGRKVFLSSKNLKEIETDSREKVTHFIPTMFGQPQSMRSRTSSRALLSCQPLSHDRL